jgi:phage baseplate assembly protein W
VADRQLELDTRRRRLLGWALRCDRIVPDDHGRDLALATAADGTVDLARTAGPIDCLAQSLSIALTTALGSDVFNTDFGFDGLRALAEETSPAMARERIRIAVVQVLRGEPRVGRILDVDVGGPQPLRSAPGLSRLQVNVAFETASGDVANVSLGGIQRA